MSKNAQPGITIQIKNLMAKIDLVDGKLGELYRQERNERRI